MACAVASATSTSDPGRAGTQTSAFNPVSERRGETHAKVPDASRMRRCRVVLYPAVNSTFEIHVSTNSAPNDMMKFARSNRYLGTSARPKAMAPA